jgi:hypothetical protein
MSGSLMLRVKDERLSKLMDGVIKTPGLTIFLSDPVQEVSRGGRV